MAITADTSARASGEPKPRLLGALLVEHGLLSAAQLQEALVEQQRTGRPLGQVIVRQGYVSRGAVAQALATQRGGIAKSEFGMAIGFETDVERTVQGPPPLSAQPSAARAQDQASEGPSYSELQLLVRAAEERLDAMAEQMAEAARRIVAAEIDRDRAEAAAAAAAERVAYLEHELEAPLPATRCDRAARPLAADNAGRSESSSSGSMEPPARPADAQRAPGEGGNCGSNGRTAAMEQRASEYVPARLDHGYFENEEDRQYLGAVLLKSKLLRIEQLDQALAEQQQTRKRLGQILIERGWLFPADIARALAVQHEVEYIDIQYTSVDAREAAQLDPEIGQRLCAIPVRTLHDGATLVAVADPTHAGIAEIHRALAGRRVVLAVAEESDIRSAWHALLRGYRP